MGLFSQQISLKKVVPLCRQLATSYDAGIPILRSLELVIRQEKDKTVRGVFTGMHNDIQRGATLGEAARAQQKHLPTFFVEMLSTGERGGKLDVMLRDLAQYFEDRLAMQRQIVGALIYPAVQLTAAWFLGTFALGLVTELLNSFKDRAPAFDLVAYFNTWLRFQAVAMTVAGLMFVASVVLSRLGLFGYVWGSVATHIWPLAPVTRKFGLARFFRSMSLLIGSGMRIDHCISSSAAVVANPYMERDLVRALPGVRDGQTLVEAFAESKMLTPTAREMIFIGEQSGNLEQTLRKVSEYHLAEATHAVQVATRILSVLIALVVGGIVAYIVFTFYSRLYGGIFDELGV